MLIFDIPSFSVLTFTYNRYHLRNFQQLPHQIKKKSNFEKSAKMSKSLKKLFFACAFTREEKFH